MALGPQRAPSPANWTSPSTKPMTSDSTPSKSPRAQTKIPMIGACALSPTQVLPCCSPAQTQANTALLWLLLRTPFLHTTQESVFLDCVQAGSSVCQVLCLLTTNRPCSCASSLFQDQPLLPVLPVLFAAEKAMRRDPRLYKYTGISCPDYRKGTCKRGNACPYAHGVFEVWLHPCRYRTQLCKDGTQCTRQVRCFAADMHTTACCGQSVADLTSMLMAIHAILLDSRSPAADSCSNIMYLLCVSTSMVLHASTT